MNKMNPDYPNNRGCFIDPYSKANKGLVSLVDYPTYTASTGVYVPYANAPIPAGKPFSVDFKTVAEAEAFAVEEHYVVCDLPRVLDPNRKNEKPVAVTSDDFMED